MYLTLYPNSELRARVAAPVARQRRAGRAIFVGAQRSYLSIVENLRHSFGDSPFKPPRPEGGRVGYGADPSPRAFSVRSRRMIARSGGALGGRGGRECTLFLTGTLPGSTSEAMRAISKWSAWICHELVSKIPRIAGVKPSECDYLWVWEWQKRGALHWHGVFEFNNKSEARKVHAKFKRLWIRIMESVGQKEGIDIAAKNEFESHSRDYKVWRTRPEWARKNPARYLAKYMAKAVSPKGEKGETFYPSRWYSVSRSLLLKMRKGTVYACVPRPKGCDHTTVVAADLELIERLFGLSNSVKQFPDKVKSGYTFVFYFPEERHQEVRDIMRSFEKGELEDFVRFGSTSRPIYYGLAECSKHSFLLERLLDDVGPYYKSVYDSWVSGQQVPDEDVFWLDHYAHQILHRQGWSYRGQPPERSGAGLPGQSAAKIDPPTPPIPDFEQPSFYP